MTAKAMTTTVMPETTNIVAAIETFLTDYVALKEAHYSLALALWILGTFCFPSFDAFPYLIITSATKRSGKTRLKEMIGFCCSNPAPMSAMTSATFFRLIEERNPTILYDEAEKLSSEASSDLRAVLNVGYRRGQTIPRTGKGGQIQDFQTYCPKVFVLIGDTFDTLRDRSILINMRRAEPKLHFRFGAVIEEGKAIRAEASVAVKANLHKIEKLFKEHEGLPYLQDRDEEIWTALFCLCEVFCPSRMIELQTAASDMAAEKTADSRSYNELETKTDSEAEATNIEYGRKCLTDMWAVFVQLGVPYIRTQDMVGLLKKIPTAPWRKFRGTGIDAHDLSNLVDRFGFGPVRVNFGSGRGNQKSYRGYKRTDVEKAMNTM